MKCPECGKDNVSYVRYCTKCGYDFFAPAIEEFGSQSLAESDPQPINKNAAKLLKRQNRKKFPIGRVLMMIIAALLIGGGVGLIGGVIGFIAIGRDRLKGAFIGSLYSTLILLGLLTLAPELGLIISKLDLPAQISVTSPTLAIQNTTQNTTQGRAQNTAVPALTASVTSEPAPGCLTWDQITLDMLEKSVCVYGTATLVYPITGNTGNTITRINFSSVHNTFYLLSTVDVFSSPSGVTKQVLKMGDCVQVTGIVKLYDDGTHKMPYMQVKSFYPCSN